MEADLRTREHVGDEHPLVDLEAGLLLLRQLALGVDRGAGRHEARVALGGLVDELGHAQRALQPVGELGVKRVDVLVQMLVASRPKIGGHVPATLDSVPAQYGSRSSRFSTLPAPDLGNGSVRSSICFGTL